MRVRNVGHDLGVAYVLEGGVRKAGETMRVSVQLVRADTGYQVWSSTYERNVRDIFKVQDEISAAVVDALKLRLSSPGSANRRTAHREFPKRMISICAASIYSNSATTTASWLPATPIGGQSSSILTLGRRLRALRMSST